MIGKIVVSLVSLFLVVGVVIGVVAFANLGHTHKGNTNGSTSASMKALSNVCGPTLYKEDCMETLRVVAQNATASPKDFIKASLQAAVAEVKSKTNFSISLVPNTNDKREKMALETCKEMMDYAVEEAQQAFSMVGNSDLSKINDNVVDLQNWLSGVLSYQGACLNELSLPEYQSAMENGILNATKLTSNALGIVNQLASILSTFDLKLQIPQIPKARRLLAADGEVLGHEQDDDGFPTWLSGPDRKLLASQDNSQPNAVVAKDGSGQYKTITAALKAYPKNNKLGRYVIYVKAGTYEEQVIVAKEHVNVYMYGDGPLKTIVTGKKSWAAGISTSNTATFAAIGTGFIAKSMAFVNTAGPDGHQAVAFRSVSDMSALFNCRMDAYQDTLYVQNKRQFYRDCVISGTVDFIFGDASAIIQNSKIIVRLPNKNQQNMVTAQGRYNPTENTGIVIQNCEIVPDAKLFPFRHQIPTFLGRPWKQYSRTIIMESVIGDFIQPAGWSPWNEASHHFHDTLFYAEYKNSGPGAVTSKRVNWKGYKVITNKNEVLKFTAANFLEDKGKWLSNLREPFLSGLKD